MCVYWSIQSIDFTKLSLEHQISFVSQDLCSPLIPRPGMMQFIRESWRKYGFLSQDALYSELKNHTQLKGWSCLLMQSS